VLLALVIALLTWAAKRLPETLPSGARQSLLPRHLWRNYVNVLRRPEFLLLGAIPALNFAAFFLYIAGAPSFLMDLLGVSSYGFAWLFIPMIAGVMIGALVSGRVAGLMTPRRTIGLGYALMFIGVATDLGVAAFVPPGVPWHVLPIMIYAMGSSVTMPSATLLLLDLFPTMRGLASSLQGFLQFVLAAVNAGTIAPMLAGSLMALALGMATFTVMSLLLWITYLRHTAQ
jgi:DHA1 family bicyclomycin/chloramphenicol resistance-like MFS transporter